ncbi:MAG: GNAT family N-acetyltransferase [Candidatus Hermodarchaeota archaeon]
MNITFSILKPEHYDQLISLWEKAGLDYRPKGRDTRENIHKQLKLPNMLFLGAFKDKQLIGVIIGSSDGRKLWINRLTVDPAYRRQNIATILLQKTEEHFQNQGIEIFAALILEDNLISIEFFEKNGYSPYPILYYRKKLGSDV